MEKMKRILRENGGLSLVEILIAMTVLALCIGPIFRSMTLSEELNTKARVRMAANDAAQSIIEGLADKTYDDVLNTLAAVEGTSGTIGHRTMFSTVNDGAFNVVKFSGATAGDTVGRKFDLSGIMTSVAINNVNGIPAKDLNKPENITKLYEAQVKVQANCMLNHYVTVGVGSSFERGLFVFQDSSKICTILTFYNVVESGKAFDVTVGFYPMAATNGDKFFPYLAYVTVYEHEDDASAVHATDVLNGTTKAIASYKTAIRNR